MQVNMAGIRQNQKNIAHKFSDAQKKVHEATSNDLWGPSSTIMAEIADMTYNVEVFDEIMGMVWARLIDYGQKWRPVYKALVLLEYLIKTGSEKVGQQCKENIFAIQTLKDFQHLEEGKDQGQNVREKAKQLVNLLKDDERLKNERARALKAKERFAAPTSGFGSDGGLDTPSPKYPALRGDWNSSHDRDFEIEDARPQTASEEEEELQLQLALAMSIAEAEQEQMIKSDDVRLQLALIQSQQDFKDIETEVKHEPQSHMLDLFDVNLGETPPPPVVDHWGILLPPRPHPHQQSSPWKSNSLFSSPPSNTPAPGNLWMPSHPMPPNPWDGFLTITPTPTPPPRTNQPKHDLYWKSPTSQGYFTDLDELKKNRTSPKTTTNCTPQSFLGENAEVVNLNNLVTSSQLRILNPELRSDLSSSPDSDLPGKVENARPQTAGEEELQLQLALTMSAEQEENIRLVEAAVQSQVTEENECVICRDKPPEFAFVPCGHRCVCPECREEILKRQIITCPVCRKNSKTVIRIYL